jgi:hypothetical protein
MLNADRGDRYMWGRRYLVIIFIRPIPRALWPTKYVDAARALGLGADLEKNLGLGIDEIRATMGWQAARGAAPGLVADMYVELWWLSMGVLLGIGWLHARCWRLAVQQGGFWAVEYSLLVSLSVYLVMQTIEAMLFRWLFMTGGAWVVWRLAAGRLDAPRAPGATPRPLPRRPAAWTSP